MYDINEKRNAVKEVQRFLYRVSENHVPITGIYDENTREAVIDFQNKKGLNGTGIVNKETLDVLYEEYTVSTVEIDDTIDFPISHGDYGEHIRDLNEKIGVLLDYYRAHHRVRTSPHYSKETVSAVEKMRQIYNLDASGEIDKELYLRINQDFDNLKI